METEQEINSTSNEKKHKRNKKKGCLIFFAIVILLLIIVSIKNCSFGSIEQSGYEAKTASYESFIAILHIEGTIEDKNETYNQQWLLETIETLAFDDKNAGIMLFIDSPGGGVYQSDEVYLQLQEYSTTGKPVWAYLGPMAASGGYYIACAAEKIYANRNCLTGSIGVIAGQSVDLSQLLEEHGIKVNSFIAGKNKDMLSFNTPVTEEQRKIMQSIADECYNQFTEIVSVSRNMPIEKVIALADGRIYTAYQALNAGLVDCVERLDIAKEAMTEALGFESQYVDFYPEEESDSWLDFFLNNIISKVNKKSVNTNNTFENKILPAIPYPAFYYHRY